MAAKLAWHGGRLMLGPFLAGEVVDVVNMQPRAYRFAVGHKQKLSDPYERITDCMQDLESEVRRLLKEAGVDCE